MGYLDSTFFSRGEKGDCGFDRLRFADSGDDHIFGVGNERSTHPHVRAAWYRPDKFTREDQLPPAFSTYYVVNR